VYKVYSTVSGRRFMCDLRDARERGFIGDAPHYNSVFRVFEDPSVTPILKELIVQSSLPLTALESDFAIDSSGFSSARLARWFDTKYGVERKRAEWVKTHIFVGVRTQVVTAIELGGSHDSKMLPPLLETTAENFRIGNVMGDKAYLSNRICELIAKAGGTPFIPPKKLNRADRGGETYRRMFHEFALHRNEWLANYHQRSNVESAFSMIKRKFGDAVRSKTPTAMGNEVLAKVLCHNLCCLNQEAHELGLRSTSILETPDSAFRELVLKFPGLQRA
jgi:transposase